MAIMFKDISRGSYIYRTKNSEGLSGIWGSILVVEGFKGNSLIVRRTTNCAPKGDPIALPATLDDGYWHDISTLVYQANSCVYPPTDRGTFLSNVAQSYRNFIDFSDLPPMSLDEAIGQVCFIGAVKNGRMLLTRSACYVVDYDPSGWVAVYNGYGVTVQGNPEQVPPELTVYYFGMGDRNFYPASEIIDACNDAYEADINRATDFTYILEQRVITSSNDACEVRANVASVGAISGLDLD